MTQLYYPEEIARPNEPDHGHATELPNEPAKHDPLCDEIHDTWPAPAPDSQPTQVEVPHPSRVPEREP